MMWAIYVALAMIAVIYSVVFGAETTRLMLFSWSLATAQAYSIEEPIIIALSILLPWVIDTLTSNEVTGEFLGSLVSALVSNCVAPIQAGVRTLRVLLFDQRP
jgi:hypothetical protein